MIVPKTNWFHDDVGKPTIVIDSALDIKSPKGLPSNGFGRMRGKLRLVSARGRAPLRCRSISELYFGTGVSPEWQRAKSSFQSHNISKEIEKTVFFGIVLWAFQLVFGHSECVGR